MAERTGIEWCDHTFNPWTGCQKVSPACDHCYAEAQAKRNPSTFGGWGPHATRKRTSESYWRQPLLWNKRAEKEGRRARVFCASMADVFDNQVPEEWRVDLWHLIRATPALDWLLLTKRPQNIAKMLPSFPGGHAELLAGCWGKGWPNVWLGTTVENQAEADRRIPELLAVRATKHFLSCEPLLGPVNLTAVDIQTGFASDEDWRFDALSGGHYFVDSLGKEQIGDGPELATIDWLIAGGESGPHARPSHPDWFRSLRDQCSGAGVPFFFKQWGEWREWPTPDTTDIGIENESPEADQIYAKAINPAFLTRDGRFITDRDELPDDGTPCRLMERVGRKAAGALLDGREHREWPA